MQGCMSSMLGNQPVQLSTGLQQLKDEHPPLLEKIDGLLELCEKAENDDKEIFQEIRPAVMEFTAELDPHSEREEGVLFEMMAAYIGKESGPIAVMAYEHNQAKTYLKTFLERTSNDKQLDAEETKEAVSIVKQASYTLIDHFAKEENVLFPMAERMLKEEEKQGLLERIQKMY